MIIIKNKLIFTLKTAIVAALFSSFMFSCAQMGTIDGGDEDTTAPRLKRSKPKIYSGNVHKKKAKLRFNEFFTLEKIDQKFLMSPPHYEKAPKIKVRGKKLITKFKEPLRDDTTYTLQFFDCIQDYHEGNHEPDYDFVFSTGAVCDSFAISGTVRDAETLTKEDNLLVGIYAENMLNEDSCFLKYKPTYITRTDTAGRFKVKNISPGRYKIFVLGDINETQKFDLENEKIGFINTIIVPEAQTVTKIDSLPAGTILHSGEPGHRIIDTLQNDTVIIQNLLYTTPNNINLVAFNQIKTIQYITDRTRDLRTRFLLGFNKSLEKDSVIITYVDDTLKSPQMYFDFNYHRDSLYVWLLDTADVRNDSLQLRVSFPTIDSLQNPTVETDTINLRYAPKKTKKDKNAKATEPEKPNIDSLSFIVNTNFKGEFDLNGLASIQIPVPTNKIDTTKIHLYQLRDTTFEDDMNQKLLKAVRLDSANFRLVFKRGVKGDIIFYPTDTTVANNWYTATYSQNRDTVNITVTDTSMVKKGRFKNILKHYNEYYLGEVQKLRDTVPTGIISQKRLSFERPSRDSVKIVLEKPLVRDVSVSAINVTTTYDVWAETYPDDYRLTIILRDTAALNKDTLAIKLSTFDRYVQSKTNNKISERFFRDTIFAIYNVKKQQIKSTQRISNDSLQFVFKYPLKDRPYLKLVDTVYDYNWYNIQLSEKQDTMTVWLNNFAANIDTLKYSITYQTPDRFDNYISKTDTLVTYRPIEQEEQPEQTNQPSNRRRSNVGLEKQKEKEEAAKNQASATLRIPVKYQLLADTFNLRDKLIKYKWEPDKKYELVVDDSVFTSILNTPNLYLSSQGTIRTEDYYGSMTINLLNTGNIEHYPDIDEDLPPFKDVDTARVRMRKRQPLVTDSTANYTSLSSGLLIVCLCNSKDEVVYSKTANCDGPLVFDFLVPGEYNLKIIHDRNSNKKWDTGDYLQHVYPERVIAYPRKQTVKSKWNAEVLWKL